MPKEVPIFEQVRLWVRKIPRGRVVTYGQLSELIEGRLSPVGIGWALHGAPEGSVPWHRVVNARGGLSTENDVPGLQRAMLEAEGVRFGPDGRIDLDRYRWRPRARKRARVLKP
ncbi:MAG TPA: MGMT family protein [Polyangia bacterium]